MGKNFLVEALRSNNTKSNYFDCNASVISYRKTALNIFFIKVFAHETVYVLRGECVRSLDSAGAYGGFPWFLSIMFPSPDFSEQKMEERMRENPIYLYS
jgi:hypothetical protein